MSRVTLAKSAGFCYGVERAVDLAEKAVEQGRAYLLGPVIHNDNVVAELERKGFRGAVIDAIDAVQKK